MFLHQRKQFTISFINKNGGKDKGKEDEIAR